MAPGCAHRVLSPLDETAGGAPISECVDCRAAFVITADGLLRPLPALVPEAVGS